MSGGTVHTLCDTDSTEETPGRSARPSPAATIRHTHDTSTIWRLGNFYILFRMPAL